MFRIITLYPFSMLYGAVVWTRNFLFNNHFLPSKSFQVPIISIGNLCAGGSGKTPQTEYIANLLKDDYRVCILSRGYGRKTKGFRIASPSSTTEEIGDEPCQYKNKFENIVVAVGEKRTDAIDTILTQKLADIILLDDAYQHRQVIPGLSVLLTSYHHLFTEDFLLPSGMLREQKHNYGRANIIVVSKCPQQLNMEERNRIIRKINPMPHQQIYFSYIKYLNLTDPVTNLSAEIPSNTGIVLFAGIANTKPLEQYLRSNSTYFKCINFPDHHTFTKDDLLHIYKTYVNFAPQKKLVVTTEKDFQRLKNEELMPLVSSLSLKVLKIEVDFLFEEKTKFNNQIISYVRQNQRNN